MHAQAIPRMLRGRGQGCRNVGFDGKPKTVEEAVDRLQFFQHSRQGRPPTPKHDVARAQRPQRRHPRDWGWSCSKIQDLQSRIKELERALQERPPVQPNPPRSTSTPPPFRAAAEGRSPPACYKCDEVGHYRQNCPRRLERQEEGVRPQRKKGSLPM